MFPLNLAIGPMPPLTRKLRPPGTAAPASPAQPWTGMACYGPLNRENHEKMMINSRQGGRGDRITSVCCGRFQRRSFGFRGPQVRIHNPYMLHIHTWILRFLRRFMKMSSCHPVVQTAELPSTSSTYAISGAWSTLKLRRLLEFSRTGICNDGIQAFQHLGCLGVIPVGLQGSQVVFSNIPWLYMVILCHIPISNIIKLFNLYVFICYVNLCQFHRKTHHQLPN